MQMKDRHRVEGTEPTIYIGHRISRRLGGGVSVSRTYHAEWTLEGRQRSKSLGTTNKAAAIRAAHALSEQLRNGMEVKPIRKTSVPEIRDAYLTSKEAKGCAPKTVDKYRHDLTEFANWWERRDGRPAMKVTEQDFWSYRKWLKEGGKSDQTVGDLRRR